jgi:CRP-like cAMP-binding protein
MAETALAVGHDHTDQRLARWLLQACDRLGGPSVAVTHEQLAQALGVRRSGATVALHMLESKGLIRSRRRLVEIRDRDGLARAATGP